MGDGAIEEQMMDHPRSTLSGDNESETRSIVVVVENIDVGSQYDSTVITTSSSCSMCGDGSSWVVKFELTL